MAMPLITNAPRMRRVNRTPQHTWTLKTRPWQLQPFCIVPVLPNETMKNLLWQARVITDPVKSPIMGWHKEYYWFYVKHRHMDISADLQKMVLEFGHDMSSLYTAADAKYFHEAASINYMKECLKVVVKHHFKQEGEAWDNVLIDGMPVASINRDTFLQSLIDSTLVPDGGTITDGDTIQEVSQLMATYQFMRDNAMTNMSYEDFLASYGVRTTDEEEDRPELLRYSKDWAYPSNTINPEDGAPSSAVSWSVAERADKDRLFKEPGFIIGITLARPKVLYNRQTSHLVDYMINAFHWMPAIMFDNPETSLQEFAKTTGPVKGSTNDYWIDIRDLFVYGDQFSNFALTGDSRVNQVALPTASLNQRYASAADALALFVDTTNGNHTIREDGVAHFTIAGTQVDHT